MRKTDILDVVARKLSPYMFLFGLYLVSFGDTSPGGGFQGGVVIASGIILLAMARGTGAAEALFPASRLTVLEVVGYVVFLAAGILGVILGVGFLGDWFARGASVAARATTVGDAATATAAAVASAHRFVFLLNLIIGVKVAAGVSLICLTLFRET